MRLPSLDKVLNILLTGKLSTLKLFKENRNFQIKLSEQNVFRQILTLKTRLVFEGQLQLQRVTGYSRKAKVYEECIVLSSYPEEMIVKIIQVEGR